MKRVVAEQSPYRLHVVPASGTPFERALDGESLVVGRAATADLVIEDLFLSRHHSRFFRRGDRLFVEDLGSRNGTLVNGRVIGEPTEVRPGDAVQISGSVLTVAPARPATAGAPGAPGTPAANGANGANGAHASVRSDPSDRSDPSNSSNRAGHFAASDLGGDVAEGDGTVMMGRDAAAIFRPAAELLGGAQSAAHYAEQLKILNEVHHALSRPIHQGALLELILDRVFDHLRPEQGVIYLKGADGGLYPQASRSVGGVQDELLASRSLAREVAGRGLAALVLDAQTDARFAGAQSITLSGVRSLLAAPLLESGDGGTLGMIVLGSKITVRQFTEADMALLVSLASVAALYLRNLALAEEAAERRRLAGELELARQIQLALLPTQLPALPGYDLYAGNQPSRGVSGDFYAVTPRAGGAECVFVIADVSGKGMAASLLTASLEAFAAGPIEDGLAAEDICARLSRLLFRRTPPAKYATAFIGVLDLATGACRYANAGHNPPLLVRATGEVEPLAATGVPIALLPGAEYTADTIALAPGDTLVLYTDGIAEATDPEDQEYGDQRLAAILVRHRADPCPILAGALEADLESFVRGTPFADDRTLILLRRRLAGDI